MYGFNVFTIFLCALALAPVVLVFRIIALEMRRKNVPLRDEYATWAEQDSGAQQQAEATPYAFERTHRHLTATARCEVDRALTVSVSQLAGNHSARPLNASAFEYTIKRHVGAIRQEALDMGGFSQVPLLLYDKTGNCFTVHRRLSLN